MLAGRRHFLQTCAFGALSTAVPGALAETLIQTPRQTQGPFYPDHLPLDTDNDLLIVNDALSSAVGEITHLSGRVLDERGAPIRNALVEIWQVDNNGIYLHTRSPELARRDTNFQGFGRFLTGSSGEYYFRTIKPVPYAPGSFQRAPHIHFAVHRRGRDKFTTQCYVKGDPLNPRDTILREIDDPRAREAVLVDFRPVPDSSVGELAAHFDIVLGVTPEDV
ncbi:MAG: intradiol ring-cleavage dioxygenase [Candidatus Hydrogenedentes bacterium]|nr:intradiol ring-cleavage dioxygenase [Candidatus Hydrogenedentota bacterium]